MKNKIKIVVKDKVYSIIINSELEPYTAEWVKDIETQLINYNSEIHDYWVEDVEKIKE